MNLQCSVKGVVSDVVRGGYFFFVTASVCQIATMIAMQSKINIKNPQFSMSNISFMKNSISFIEFLAL